MSDPIVYGPFISRKQAKEQGLKHYFTVKPCPHGHITFRFVSSWGCNDCVIAHSKVWKAQKRINDPAWAEAEVRAVQQWRKSNPERKQVARDRWRDRTREEQNAKQRKRDKAPHIRERNAAYSRKRSHAEPAFRLLSALRTRVYNAVRGVGAKSAKTLELIGCSVPELQAYLEEQWSNDMAWQNYGEWHIDHIRPCASFDLTDPEQQKQCFHYTNLQPLWAEDNLRKSDHWDEPMAA